MQLSVKELAQLVKGEVEGDPEVMIYRPSRIEEAEEGSVSFLGNEKYLEYVYSTRASALLVNRSFDPQEPVRPVLIRVENVYPALALVLESFSPPSDLPRRIAENACVHERARIGANVAIGNLAIVEAEAEIGEGSTIHPQVYVGPRARLGRNVTVHPGVRILRDCVIGDNCVIHSNTVIGSDGFGFAQQNGIFQKIPQIGNVILENNVEIGACTTIDRATMGSTIIRSGAKLDNLIQIGHNVEIGENTVVAAQAGIAGSTRIGKNCQIGGQAGFVGHLDIADGVRIQAQSGIASSLPTPNQALFGSPAIPYNDYIRSYTIFKKLPELYKRIHQLEKKLGELGELKEQA